MKVKKFKKLALGGGSSLAFGLILAACSSNNTATTTSSAASTTPPAQAISLTLDKATPSFAPSDVTVKKGATVTLTIVSNDEGSAPLPAGMTQYDNVQGGTETVDGQPVTSEANSNVSHTFTVAALGLNVVIPTVPTGQSTVKVVYTFTATKTGSYVWKCFAPCGSGSDGMEGPMATMGDMEGNFVVS